MRKFIFEKIKQKISIAVKKYAQKHPERYANVWNRGTKNICKPNSGSFKKGMKISIKTRKLMGQKKEKHWNWKGGCKTVKCLICGKKYILARYNDDSKFCSRKCYWQSLIINIHKTGYPSDWTDTLKHSIRERDNFKCRDCGMPQEEESKAFHIHHSDLNKENLNPDNLITLCKKCHAKRHYEWRQKCRGKFAR